MKKETKEEEKKDIFDLLEHYKCSICKEEFYLLKDEKDKEDEIFQDEEYAHLPIFLKEDPKKITCPYCKASRRSLLYLETEKEKKSRLDRLKEELKKIKEEEKKLDELRKNEIDKLCKDIEDDVLSDVKTLIDDIKSSKYDTEHLLNAFRKSAYSVVDRCAKLYNKKNKEVNIVLSNSYMAGFDRVITDFTNDIYDAYKSVTRNVENIKEKAEYDLENDKTDSIDKEKIKENLSKDIDSEKDEFNEKLTKGKYSVKDDFKHYLKSKIK